MVLANVNGAAFNCKVRAASGCEMLRTDENVVPVMKRMLIFNAILAAMVRRAFFVTRHPSMSFFFLQV